MKLKFKILIIVGIILLASAPFILDEILYQYTLRTALLVGGDSDTNSPSSLGLGCWGHLFIKERSIKFVGFAPSPQLYVNAMRNLTNNNYTSFENSLNNQNIVNNESIFSTAGLVYRTNSIESVSAVLKNEFPIWPQPCNLDTSYQGINKVLSMSFSLMQNVILTSWYNNIISKNNDFCINQTDYNICTKKWISLFENVSTNKKNSLLQYKENILPDCAKTIVYKDSKQIENELRNQLGNATDSFSILWKSMQIEMYDKCSEKYYETIKDNPCDLSQFSKSKSLSIILGGNGFFASCVQSYLKNETSKLSEQLNLTKV